MIYETIKAYKPFTSRVNKNIKEKTTNHTKMVSKFRIVKGVSFLSEKYLIILKIAKIIVTGIIVKINHIKKSSTLKNTNRVTSVKSIETILKILNNFINLEYIT